MDRSDAPSTTCLMEALVLKKLTLVAGFGAGYVLGAKAGKERYTQIEAKFREIAGMPAVQDATSSVKQAASGLADTAKTTVTETAQAVSDKVSEKTATPAEPVIDLGAPVGAETGATRPAPMAGAAPSGSVPDALRP